MNKTGVSKFIQISGLLLLLVVLPLVSWYYLSQGYDYQLKARSELKNYGKWSVLGSGLDTMGYTIVFAQLDENAANDSKFNEILNRLVNQFGERPDFFIGLLDGDKVESSLIINDSSKVIFFDLDKFNTDEVLLRNKFYLADRTGTLRNNYNINQVDEIKRMVEHIALILPQQPSSDIFYVPEEEK